MSRITANHLDSEETIRKAVARLNSWSLALPGARFRRNNHWAKSVSSHATLRHCPFKSPEGFLAE
jgi:hypothetical protein